MAMGTVGLKTHIWNNNFKSFMLLATFPLLFFLITWMTLGLNHYFMVMEPKNGGNTLYSCDNILNAHDMLRQMYRYKGDYPAHFTFNGFQYDSSKLDSWAMDCRYGAGYELSGTKKFMESAEASFGDTVSYTPYIYGGVAIWFIIAWLFHQKMIDRATGARPVSRKDQPRLYNLLENLCISRGITMPTLRVIPTQSLNAYASGISEKSYTITVTQGLIKQLNDKELEAVLAHELTHIINRDVRLLIISVIFVGIISTLTEMMFRSFLYGGRRRSRSSGKGGGAIVLFAMAALAVGYVLAMVIRFSLSRKREFMADAGAVELTKNPRAMIGALQKISGKAKMGEIPGEVEQMFIENPPRWSFMKTGFFSLFATHPPIEKRIEVLRNFL